MSLASTAKMIAELILGKDTLTPGVAKAVTGVGKLEAKVGGLGKVGQDIGKHFGKGVRTAARNLERLTLAAGAAVVGAGVAVVRQAADYESAFAGVRKTVTATDAELNALSDQFRKLSKEIPISASELARLGEAGGALGVPTKQLGEFVRVTALLGVTTNLTADEAADSLGVIGNVLHLTGQEYSKFASSLVALGNAGASTESDIIAIAQRAGAAGSLIGASTPAILGFSSAVASIGIEAEAGGTALQKFFIDSAKAVAKGGKDLTTFATTAGTSAKDFKKLFEKDASGALQKFLAGLGKLSQAKQLDVLEKLGFNDARITRTLLGLANNTQLVSDQMGVANTAFVQNTALTKEANQRFATFDSQLQITKNTLADMAITIGSKLLPKITPLLKRLNEFINSHSADIGKFGDDIADGFSKAADFAMRIDWDSIGSTVRGLAGVGKTLAQGFIAMPTEAKQLILGLYGLNKLSGGAVVNIGLDIAKGGFQQLFARGATPANPVWVASATPQLGGGPGGGAPGVPIVGGGGGILNFLKTALPVALASLAVTELVNVQQSISGRSSEQAATAHETLKVSLASSPPLDDLRTKMAAVDTGIREIQSNPLNVLVAGDALDQLRSMKNDIATQVRQFGNEQIGERLATLSDKTGAVRAATSLVAAKQEETRRAIKAIPAPIQTTNVRVDVKTYVSSRDITYKQNKKASVVTGHAVNRGALAADL